MEFIRILRKGMSGEDVLFFKQRLLSLGFYVDHITPPNTNAVSGNARGSAKTRIVAPRRICMRTRFKPLSCRS